MSRTHTTDSTLDKETTSRTHIRHTQIGGTKPQGVAGHSDTSSPGEVKHIVLTPHITPSFQPTKTCSRLSQIRPTTFVRGPSTCAKLAFHLFLLTPLCVLAAAAFHMDVETVSCHSPRCVQCADLYHYIRPCLTSKRSATISLLVHGENGVHPPK